MVDLSRVPAHLLARAALMPENRHALPALERAQAARAASAPRPRPEAPKNAIAAPRKGKRRGEPNQTENRFAADVLDGLVHYGEIGWYEYESITLRVSDVGAVTPDYSGWKNGTLTTLYEVKGQRVHEASVLRMKAHAAARPWLRWMIWKRVSGLWAVHFDSART